MYNPKSVISRWNVAKNIKAIKKKRKELTSMQLHIAYHQQLVNLLAI
uniref:Uncharacterized protein n=1 Tax=Leersia perrieri TaxID=77586 RepID=A0A0D9VKA1_9ORYZ